ncbi:TonB-dependent siderophore receptor [Marinomonas posidonica]|uniref:TonB-dependent siderophore receptor n=1 Tax=Marinomonas posidonica (strain CECT 7376 / NCIMB 14433 / IVIA-Po-181) TaxID=491952 RepID=F6CZV9_MARPP|nr:TonB-dependent siderophore receptor [Marinomonas posidonica]AEF53620.1 TonB-dependent siderophore receptor [Marinomonas posidonica IVIA-Po-181]
MRIKLTPYTTSLFCCSVILPSAALAEANEDVFRLSPILINGQAEETDDDSESVVATELWVGGKVATSIQDTPASVSVITEKEIQQRGASTTEEVLQYTPGTVTGYYGADDRTDFYQIRGFNASTYRDGLYLGSLFDVREDPFAYERVEVIRGANSTLFGPAEPGGSINFVSKTPKFDEFSSAYLTYGSHDHKEIGIDMNDTLDENDTLAYRLTAKVKDSDREYDYSKDDSQFVMSGLTWQPNNKTSATLLVDYLNTDASANSSGAPFDKEYDRSTFFGEPDFNYQDVERTNISAQINHSLDNGLKVSSNLRYTDSTNRYGYTYITDSSSRVGDTVSRGFIATDTAIQEFSGNLLGQYDIRFDRLDSSTVFGIEYQDSSKTENSAWGTATSIDVNNIVYSGAPSVLTPYADKKTDYQTQAAFLQQNLAWDDKYILSIGARHDDIDVFEDDYQNDTETKSNFSENTFRSALTYKFSDQVSAYISQVESVSPPSVGTEIVRGDQTEIGAKFSTSDLNAIFSVAIYDLEKSNVNIAVAQDDGSIDREVIGKNRVKGVDLEVRAELTESVSLSGGYSYMDSEVTEDDTYEGKDFATTPQHSASLWGHYILPRQDMSIGLGARYVGSYYFDAANSKKSEAAVTLDASFSYDITQATQLAMNISNLLDEQHVVGSGTADFYNRGRDITMTVNHAW